MIVFQLKIKTQYLSNVVNLRIMQWKNFTFYRICTVENICVFLSYKNQAQGSYLLYPIIVHLPPDELGLVPRRNEIDADRGNAISLRSLDLPRSVGENIL